MSNIIDLPRFVQYKILWLLPLKALGRMFQVNQTFNAASQNENFWYFKVLIDRPGCLVDKPIHLTSKEYYRHEYAGIS